MLFEFNSFYEFKIMSETARLHLNDKIVVTN